MRNLVTTFARACGRLSHDALDVESVRVYQLIEPERYLTS